MIDAKTRDVPTLNTSNVVSASFVNNDLGNQSFSGADYNSIMGLKDEMSN